MSEHNLPVGSLSKNAIEEFQELCRAEFGLELSDSDAEREALRVLSLFWLVLTDDEGQADDNLTDRDLSIPLGI